MQVRAVVLALVVVTFVVGCASVPPEPPGTYEFDPVIVINADFDVVWDVVVEFVAISGLPIDRMEKESGVVVTSWMDASRSVLRVTAPEDKSYCDCGRGREGAASHAKGKSTILVRAVAGGGTVLDVTFVYQQGISHRRIVENMRHSAVSGIELDEATLVEKYGIGDCSSTGYLEQLVHAYVRAKIEGGLVPRVPTFRSPK